MTTEPPRDTDRPSSTETPELTVMPCETDKEEQLQQELDTYKSALIGVSVGAGVMLIVLICYVMYLAEEKSSLKKEIEMSQTKKGIRYNAAISKTLTGQYTEHRTRRHTKHFSSRCSSFLKIRSSHLSFMLSNIRTCSLSRYP